MCVWLDSQMNFITPLVAVGALGDALDLAVLKEQGIEAVLSFAPVNLDGAVEHHLQLEIADRVPIPFDIITVALAFIRHHVEQDRRVLLHCEMGISRSPSLAICYLHESQGMPIEDAVRHVKFVREQAEPHPLLMESIRGYFNGKPESVDR